MVGIMNEVGSVLASMSDHWQGVAVLLIVIMCALVGPLAFVLNKMMDLQAREGEANRALIRELGQLQRESAKEHSEGSAQVAEAVHKVELALTTLTTRWGS